MLAHVGTWRHTVDFTPYYCISRKYTDSSLPVSYSSVFCVSLTPPSISPVCQLGPNLPGRPCARRQGPALRAASMSRTGFEKEHKNKSGCSFRHRWRRASRVLVSHSLISRRLWLTTQPSAAPLLPRPERSAFSTRTPPSTTDHHMVRALGWPRLMSASAHDKRGIVAVVYGTGRPRCWWPFHTTTHDTDA